MKVKKMKLLVLTLVFLITISALYTGDINTRIQAAETGVYLNRGSVNGLKIDWYTFSGNVYEKTKSKYEDLLNQSLYIINPKEPDIITRMWRFLHTEIFKERELSGEIPCEKFDFRDEKAWIVAYGKGLIIQRDGWNSPQLLGEATGFIKIPDSGKTNLFVYRSANTAVNVYIDGKLVYGACSDFGFTDNSDPFYVNKSGDYKHIKVILYAIENTKPIRCDIGLNYSKHYVNIGTTLTDVTQNMPIPIPADSMFLILPLDGFINYIEIDNKDHKVTLKDLPYGVDPAEYEIGITNNDYKNWKDVRDLSSGVYDFSGQAGSLAIRVKNNPDIYHQIGYIKPDPVTDLAITKRTPTTATLTWSAPRISPEYYEIYRREAAIDRRFINTGFKSITVTPEDLTPKIASTQETVFTDDGLSCDTIYEYSVRAVYPMITSEYSNWARTDSVVTEGLPTIPEDLEMVSKTDSGVTIKWSASKAESGIKEYRVYRKLGKQNKRGIYEGELLPGLIGNTATAGYTDEGLFPGDKCVYYVEAVDNNGVFSHISQPLSVRINDQTPPTAPENLQAGYVEWQDGEARIIPVSSFYASQGISKLELNQNLEAGLTWDASGDNVGVTGYDIYRDGSGTYFDRYGHKKSWLKINVPVGSTENTYFVDSGLEPGGDYFYKVIAKDAAGHASKESRVRFVANGNNLKNLTLLKGTGKKGKGNVIDLGSDFNPHQYSYTLEVENGVKNITVIPEPVDKEAKIRVNGSFVLNGDASEPLPLQIGDNEILIGVKGRTSIYPWTDQPVEETRQYSIKVKRANMDYLPDLVLTGSETADEGGAYRVHGYLGFPMDSSLVDENISVDTKTPPVPADNPEGGAGAWPGTWQATVDYGDGTEPQPITFKPGYIFDLEHCYRVGGDYTINVTVTYEDTGLLTGSLPVKVNNVAPVLMGPGMVGESFVENGVTIDNEVTVNEGDILTLEGVIVDPGDNYWNVDYAFTYPGHNGDDTEELLPVSINDDKTFIIEEKFYDQQPVYYITVRVKDNAGGFGERTIKVNVDNLAPVTDAGSTAFAEHRMAFTREGHFTDPGMDTWTGFVDYGDGSGEKPLALTPEKSFILAHTYQQKGSYTVKIRIKDNDGGVGIASFPLKVKDYIFGIKAGEDTTIKEGETFSRIIDIAGPMQMIDKMTVDYGDASDEKALVLEDYGDTSSQDSGNTPVSPDEPINATQNSCPLSAGGRAALSHTYKKSGIYTVIVRLIDAEGDVYKESFNVNVENVPPVVNINPLRRVYSRRYFTCSGSFTDPGDDTWTASIDFGDYRGIRELDLSDDKTFGVRHIYRNRGNYTITVQVRDDDGGEGTDTVRASVRFKPRSKPNPSGNAYLSGLEVDVALVQNDPPGYTDEGFNPQCLKYAVSGGGVDPTSVAAAAADAGATITVYDEDAGNWVPFINNMMVGYYLPGPLEKPRISIRVTAADGKTVNEYTIFRGLAD